MPTRSSYPGRIIRDEACVAVAKAARNGGVVFPVREAKLIAERYPDCGMTEDEIRRELFQLAVQHRLAVNPTA